MKCPNCHKDINDDCLSCPNCGQKIIKEKICPNCHASNDADALYCKKCGSKLDSSIEDKVTKEPINPARANYVLSIIAMSLIVFSIMISSLTMFLPFLESDFYPGFDFTILGWSINVLSSGMDVIKAEYAYVPLVNSILLLSILAIFEIISITFLIISIIKLVKGIKQKKYFDLSKFLIELYALYFAIYIYFTNYVLNSELPYSDARGGVTTLLLVFIPLVLSFNIFTKVRIEKNIELKHLLTRAISRTGAFILIIIALTNLGGDRFMVISKYRGSHITSCLGNIDLVDYFLGETPAIIDTALPYLRPALILSIVSALFEIIILTLLMRLVVGCLSSEIINQGKYKTGIVYSAIMIFSSIGVLILNAISVNLLNNLNSVSQYGLVLDCSLLNIRMVVSYLIISILLLAHYIVLLNIDKNGKEVVDESKE